MKIALTTTGQTLCAPLEPRFGRSPHFLIYDTEKESIQIVCNKAADAAQGAGLRAAETLLQAGARIVITGRCGPKAFKALNSNNVKIYSASTASVAEALELWRDGKLDEMRGA